MSNAPAYLPLFGSDYLADTRHLTTEEHGAYLLLLIAAWRQDDCGLPMDDKKLARIAGLSARKWAQMKDTILEFWKVESGRIYQARLHKEWAYARKKSEGNRENARKRWEAQVPENIEGDECDRISDGNAPQPQPHIEQEEGKPSPCSSAGAKKKTGRKKRDDHPLPDGWEPAPFGVGTKSRSIEDGWPPGQREEQFERFAAHHRKIGSQFCDWQAAWGTWVLNSVKFGNRDGNRNGQANGGFASGYRQPDRRDGTTRAIDRLGGFDQPGGFAQEAG